jgi:hypothetical protein
MFNQPKTGIPRGFGSTGGGNSKSNLYYIVGGNALTFLGAVGIKHVTTTITTAAKNYTGGTPTTLPDGLGWIRSLDDNTYAIACNDSTSYISYDISANQVVYAVKTGTLTGTETVGTVTTTWSYDKYTICGVA